MADEHTRDELAQLRTLIETQQAEFAAYRARHERPRRRRLPRRFLPLALAALLVALVPLATLAASPFNDLTGGVHDSNIGLIYDAGITKGCVPNVSYCPTANVTREEMASFLARTAGLGTNPPVVNAKTAQTAALATNATSAIHATSADTATSATNATHAASADTATTATNAATVGGYAPNGLVRVARMQKDSGLPSLTTTPQSFGSLTLTAPTAGFVLVTGTVQTRPSNAGCVCTVFFSLYDENNQSESNYSTYSHQGTEYQSGTTTFVFSATAGVHTYTIKAKQFSGTATVVGDFAVMSAIFTPFGSTGAATLEAGTSTPGTSPTTIP